MELLTEDTLDLIVCLSLPFLLIVAVVHALTARHNRIRNKRHAVILQEAIAALDLIRSVKTYMHDDEQALDYVVRTAEAAHDELKRMCDDEDPYI